MKKNQLLRIGSRGSKLALWQARYIKSIIQRASPDLSIDIKIIKTTGDNFVDSPLSDIGGKGVFIKEIEEALFREDIDIAVHSMKDVPTILPKGLKIGAVAPRHDPRDVLISKHNIRFQNLKKGARIGTSSLRRQAQLLGLSSGIEVVPVRGNVDTRLKKLETSQLDSIVLAMAGVERMGLRKRVTECFPIDTLVPAPGQGAIAIECRDDDSEIEKIVCKVNHKESEITSMAERSFLEMLEGDCKIPAGCYASVEFDKMNMIGLIASPDGTFIVKQRINGDIENHVNLGRELGRKILGRGGREILSAINKAN